MPHKCYVKSKSWPLGKNIVVFREGNVVNNTIEKVLRLDYKVLDN